MIREMIGHDGSRILEIYKMGLDTVSLQYSIYIMREFLQADSPKTLI
jgi:hypothetical protein